MSTTPEGPNTGNHPSETDEPGGPVPPYDGRKEAADVESADDGGEASGVQNEGANVAGGQRPKESDEMKAPEPADTPGARPLRPATSNRPRSRAVTSLRRRAPDRRTSREPRAAKTPGHRHWPLESSSPGSATSS